MVLLVVRRRRIHGAERVVLAVVAAGCVVYGTGVVHLPDLEGILTDVGRALGPWTYLLVGVMAFLETGAFVGLVAPGETTIIVGGVVAGQGEIDIIALIAIVWVCAVAGDVTSFLMGRRLGRSFLVRHGGRFGMTEERIGSVDVFFERHGGKAVFLGRFVGLVRAVAPFLAGSSGMSLRRFLPYDILGAGLWGTALCLLGFVFWRSLDRVLAIAKEGALALGLVICVVVAVVWVVRRLRDPEQRARLVAAVEAHAQTPVVGPPVRLGMRAAAWLDGPARFLWARLTPGDLGLEVTTLLAVAAVGSFTFFGYLIVLGRGVVQTAGDRRVVGWALDLRSQDVLDVVRVFTDLGALPVTGTFVVGVGIWCFVRGRAPEGWVLIGGGVLTWASVTVTKTLVDRPRPSIAVYDAAGMSYPSGHAAYAMAVVAAAIVLTRGTSRTTRIAVLTVAGVYALLIGASRLYLGVHYLSDVLGGYGLSAMIFSLAGVVAMVVVHLRQNQTAAA